MSVPAKSTLAVVDRRLYVAITIAAILLVVIGFARTFYLKPLFETPPISNLLWLHGVIMTLWLVLFVVQIRLIATGRRSLHQQTGKIGAVLFVLILAVGTAAAIASARQPVSPVPGVTPIMFLAVPMVTLLVFALLVAIVLWKRRQSDVHKRLMLLATLSITTPGIARIPLGFIQHGGLPVFFGITIVIVLFCVIFDTVMHKRLHPAFGWGAALIVVAVPLRIALAGTLAWKQFATWLIA